MSFAFVTGFVAKTQAPPLLFGWRASLYRPNHRETFAMRDCYILCGRSDVTWSAWAAHRQRCERFLFAVGCSMKELSKNTVSFWLRMPLSRVCWLSVTERSVLCPLSSVLLCCRSVSSLRSTLLSSWWWGESVALAFFLSRLLLRGSCPSVPRNLAPVLCGGGAVPGLSRACSPRHITTYDMESGPWARLPCSFSYPPLPSYGLSRLGVRVCLHILKCCLYYFLEILDSISSESLVPS